VSPEGEYTGGNPNPSKAVEAIYCYAHVDGRPIYLILDSGSAGSVMSKSFLQQLGRRIESPSQITMINIQGGRSRPLGQVANIPIQIDNVEIPMNVDITESNDYYIVAGNDWLTKCQAQLHWDKGAFIFKWNGIIHQVPMTCWEKPIFDQFQQPTPVTTPINDEYEEETLTSQRHYAVLGDNVSQPILAETKPDQILIQGQCYSPQYYENLKQKFSIQPPTNEKWKYHWQGPGNRCWCHQRLDKPTDVCELCQKEWEHLQLLSNIPEEKPRILKSATSLEGKQQQHLTTFLKQYDDLFADDLSQLGHTNVETHHIPLESDMPIRQRAYRVAPPEQDFIKEEIDKMLKNKLIQPSESPWASPVVLVRKKNGKLRFCVDYRKLNSVTRRDCYPLPRIDELLDMFGKAKYFTTLDLASGYWQVAMTPEDQQKTAFITSQGLYEFTVMPFGLTNAPATFQRLMNKVFREEIGKYVAVYLDDIIIYSTTFEEHLTHLKNVLQQLRKAGLKLGRDKCEFGKLELAFLGHIVNGQGIAPDPSKIEKIRDFPIPSNITELRGFLGLASYYRRFIQNFSTIAAPLHLLLKKETPYTWTEIQQQAFEYLKQCLITAPILIYPDFSKRFLLFTDGSYVGLGAVLTQLDDQQKEHVVAYASRTLNNAERNYAPTELECLAAVWAMEHFRTYLLHQPFDLITDHAALQWLFNKPDPPRKFMRWIVRIMEFPYNIRYRKGKLHQNADALSRLPPQ